ncbi:MAG: histidine triad nucleotide-binding protein [Puniceicoccaceae bacterium]
MSEPTLFERILAGEIPAEIVFQDDLAFVIKDINPQAPVHCLVIPKKPLPRVGHATDDDRDLLGHLLLVAGDMARKLNLAEDGYRIVINNGPNGGESVPHLHVHLIGGRQMTWPPG